MDGPCRNQKVIMFFCRELIDVLLCRKRLASRLRAVQIARHLSLVDAILQAEIDTCILASASSR